MGRLGQGNYRAFITERGGSPTLAELPWTALSFGRVLDEMGSGRVSLVGATLEDVSESCCLALENLAAWKHEIAIWRDPGHGTEPDYIGVVTEPEFRVDSVTIHTRDLFQHFEKRLHPTDHDPITGDAAEVFEDLAVEGLSGDTTPNITVTVQSLAGVDVERRILASERRKVADTLRELGRTSVDFTMRGRELVVAGQSLAWPNSLTVDSIVAENLLLREKGLEGASLVYVKGYPGGAGSTSSYGADTAQIEGSAGGVDADIGLVEMSISELGVRDEIEATFAAASELTLRNPPPYVLSCDLLPGAPIDFQDLLPGLQVLARVRLACRNVSQDFVCPSIQVNVQPSDQGEKETISLQLEPTG